MKGSKRKLDVAAKYDLSAYKNNGIQEDENLYDVYSVLRHVCDDKAVADIIFESIRDIYTGEFPIDLVMATYAANVLAHENHELETEKNIIDRAYDSDTFYKVKSKLLEYIFQNNIWGMDEYCYYGIGVDNYENDVAYFDVPGYGQVSFHLPETNYDGVRDYEYGWKGVRNETFPSYSNIDNFHDLQMALWGEERDIFEGIEIELPDEYGNYQYGEDDEHYDYDDEYDDYDDDEYYDYDDEYDDYDSDEKFMIGSVDLSNYTNNQLIYITRKVEILIRMILFII